MSIVRSKVIARIKADLSDRFMVLDNTGDDKKLVAGQFPDVLILKKDSSKDDELLFILKVENGGELVDNVSQWKELASAPNTFYIVVHKEKLDEAKKLADATGIIAKFAWYEMTEDENVTTIHYE